MKEFESLNKAKRLIEDGGKIASFHDDFKIETDKRNIDKYSSGFNADNRFKSFSVEIFFSAYTGSYGSSSVGSFLRLTEIEAINSALIEYLNNNEKDVLKGMAEIIENKAKKLINSARKEINDAVLFLDEIDSDENR